MPDEHATDLDPDQQPEIPDELSRRIDAARISAVDPGIETMDRVRGEGE